MDNATNYEIRMRGRLSTTTLGLFSGLRNEPRPAETVFVGELRDQSELHRLLGVLQDLGVELVEVRPIPETKIDASVHPQTGAVADGRDLRAEAGAHEAGTHEAGTHEAGSRPVTEQRWIWLQVGIGIALAFGGLMVLADVPVLDTVSVCCSARWH